MKDATWIVSLILVCAALGYIILSEFVKAFRTGHLAMQSAGRITWSTGFLFMTLIPQAFPGLPADASNQLWWLALIVLGIGVVMETSGRRNIEGKR